uniref:Uncharacterized protein n=1 Tax=Acrobeloides nanus TaxID=290746 RepID=A0A914EFJ8_9BILA
MDEFLIARGIGWFKRQLFKTIRPTRIFEKSAEIPGTFNVKILTAIKDVIWKNISLGKEFETIAREGIHKVLYTYDPVTEKLYERHIHFYMLNDNPDIATYYIAGKELVLQLECNGIIARRYYKKAK